MAEGFDLTTYYAKRIIGDTAAASAASALLQTGTDIAGDTWILHRDNRTSKLYGIKYAYDSTNGHDKIQYYGKNSNDNPTAWIQLDTGDASFIGNITANKFIGPLQGNADTASAANLTTVANTLAYYSNTTGAFADTGIKYFSGTANAGKTYIGWVKFASIDIGTNNYWGDKIYDIFLDRGYNSPQSEVYSIRVSVGWGASHIIQLSGRAGSQIMNKFRIVRDHTNHIAYFEYYVNTSYTTYQNTVNIKILSYHGAAVTLMNTVQTEDDSEFSYKEEISLTSNSIVGNLTGNASTATQVKVTNLAFPSSGSQVYYPTFAGSTTTGNQDIKDSAHLYLYESTTASYLNIGSGSSSGGITIHNANGKYVDIVSSAFGENRTITLPNQTGTIALLTKTDINALINLLDEGTSVLTGNDYIITQYVGGGTTTTTYHRRMAKNVRVGGLTTARNINGTAFDGTADITTANWGTTRSLTIGNKAQDVNGSAAVTWSLNDILLNATQIGTATSWDQVGPSVYYVASSSAFTGTNHPGNNSEQMPYTYGQLIVSRTGSGGILQVYASHHASNSGAINEGLRYRTGWNSGGWQAWSTLLDDRLWRKYIFANKNIGRTTLTVTDSTWAVTSGTDVFGLSFKDTGLTYTPSGGSATASSDTGDWRAWLVCDSTANNVTLNMRIDGTWQALKFIGPLQGNADTVSRATFGDAGNGTHDANSMTSNGLYYYGANGPSTTLGASTVDGAMYVQAHSASWVGQIAQDYRNGGLYVRGKNNGTWQSWIGIPKMAVESYPALLPPTGTNNWIKIGTANTSYGLLPSQAGNAGSGHNYLGTSSWYWKYAYIDEIYGHLNGNCTGSSGSCTGNAATATTATAAGLLNINNRAPIKGNNQLEFQQFNGTGSTGWNNSNPTNDWYHHIRMNHANANGYFVDLAFCFHSENNYIRRVSNGSDNGWKRLWTQGNSVTSAVWNDYAENRTAINAIPGQVLYELGDDTLAPTTERLQHFAGIASDTWGFSQGETDTAKTPIAVAGRVLAYTYRNREEYKPGDVLCAAPNGTVDIMTREEIYKYPDRIVGTVSCVPKYEEWGGGDGADREPVKVDGRIWVKVK